jgi:hypothetical protein
MGAGTQRLVSSPRDNLKLMPIIVETADLRADRAQLVALLTKVLNPSADDRRFDWLYLKNPDGPAHVWLAYENETRKLLGASAIFPRRLKVHGQEVTGCVFGDFCVSQNYRTLGPALLLQRASIKGMHEAGFEYGYDLPSTSMLGVYKRLNIAPNASLVRMAKPLRANRKVAEKVKSKAVARAATVAANALLTARDVLRRKKSSATIEFHKGRFGAEFTALANRAAAAGSIHVHRRAEYLNWRFLDHPQSRFEILTARKGKDLKGYMIFQADGADGRIIDLFADDPAEFRRGLVAGAVEILRARGCEIVSLPISAGHPWRKDLTALGFRPRESQPMVTMHNPAGANDKKPWLFLEGDRES